MTYGEGGGQPKCNVTFVFHQIFFGKIKIVTSHKGGGYGTTSLNVPWGGRGSKISTKSVTCYLIDS